MPRLGPYSLSLWLTEQALDFPGYPKPGHQSEGPLSADSAPGHSDSAADCSCSSWFDLVSQLQPCSHFYPSFDNWVFFFFFPPKHLFCSYQFSQGRLFLNLGLRTKVFLSWLSFVCFYWKHSSSALCKPTLFPNSSPLLILPPIHILPV